MFIVLSAMDALCWYSSISSTWCWFYANFSISFLFFLNFQELGIQIFTVCVRLRFCLSFYFVLWTHVKSAAGRLCSCWFTFLVILLASLSLVLWLSCTIAWVKSSQFPGWTHRKVVINCLYLHLKILFILWLTLSMWARSFHRFCIFSQLCPWREHVCVLYWHNFLHFQLREGCSGFCVLVVIVIEFNFCYCITSTRCKVGGGLWMHILVSKHHVKLWLF